LLDGLKLGFIAKPATARAGVALEEKTVINAFSGFTPESFRFFQELIQNNHKLWFDQNRQRYDRYVVEAFRSLLGTLRPFLLRHNRHFETAGKTNGNFSRINRDIRFSKDKRPYKPNYYLYVYDRRHDRSHAGRLYVGLSADCLTVGFSIYDSERRDSEGALRTIFRKRVITHRQIFDRLLEKIVRGRHYETYWHRVERGDWAQHPGLPRRDEDWLTLQAWVVRRVFLPNARGLTTPAFARRVEQIFAELYPLYVFTSDASPRWQSRARGTWG
jgi:uncharacterized protein (TIGR02453 family)